MLSPFDIELAAIRQVRTSVRRAVTRQIWLAAMQRRTTLCASVLRMMPKTVHGQNFRRTKSDGSWHIFIDGREVLSVRVRTPGRTLEELAAPLPVLVLDPGRVRPERLQLLLRRRMIVLAERA